MKYRATYPLLALCLWNGSALALVALGASLWWLLPLLAAAIATGFAVERVAPFEPAWNRSQGDARTNAIHAGVNELLTLGFVASVPVLLTLLPWPRLWPDAWPLPLQLLIAVGVADFGISFVHAASHRVPWLWRLHAIHHGAPRLYGLNGLMKHPSHQLLETLGGTLPLAALGMPTPVAALFGFAVAIQLLVQHANVDVELGALRPWLAVGPSHRLHHVRGLAGDVNFGLFTSLPDRVLGTWRTPAVGEALAPIGVDEAVPRHYAEQLRWPFAAQLESRAGGVG